jgi:hypothetical protein
VCRTPLQIADSDGKLCCRASAFEILQQLTSSEKSGVLLTTSKAMGEQSMFDRSQQQSHDRGGDRERDTNPRQTAEALFTPRRPLPEDCFGLPRRRPASQCRKPRVLSVSPPAPYPRQERLAALTGAIERLTPEIPKSQLARIRVGVDMV